MDTVKTGDILLFSGNSPTGFLLKTFVSSEWNHSGIAVRFIKSPDTDQYQISLTEEGELFVYETNTGLRRDYIYGDKVQGAAFTDKEWLCRKYNKIALRRLKEVFRNSELAEKTIEFSEKTRGKKFPSSSLPFIGAWLGISLDFQDKSSFSNYNFKEMFCSELMAHYYLYCIGPQYEKITGQKFDEKLTTLFGKESPLSENIFTPGHYTVASTPNAAIFEKSEEIIYIAHADLYYIIFQPFLIVCVLAVIFWMCLPHKR